jgi:TonB family protein
LLFRHPSSLLRFVCGLLAVAALVVNFRLPSSPALAHAAQDANPFQVTSRVYQARAKHGSYGEVNSQVFRLRTENLVDEEKWTNAFKKVYPEFDIALLQNTTHRVYRSSRAARIVLGSANGRTLEILQTGAHSYGDGKTSGTTLILEFNLNTGRPEALALNVQALEVADGMTYFFCVPKVQMTPTDYVNFIRPGAPHEAFEGDDFLFIFSFSVELKPGPVPTRMLGEKESESLISTATRKPMPEVPAELKQKRLSGTVRARVEITPEGRVSHSYLVNSSFPEMNALVLKSAREWEFSSPLLTADKRPISALLKFDFAPPPPAPKK